MSGEILSIIIVNWNTRDMLRDCIDSVISSTHDVSYEIIVVDNGSTDGSAKHISELYPDVQVLALRDNVGYAKANNIGLGNAKGKYICLLNSDTIVLKSTFESIIGFIKTNTGIGAVTPKLLNADDTPQFSSAMGEPNLHYMLAMETGLYKKYPKTRLFGKPFLSYRDYSKPQEIEICPSPAMVIPRRVVHDVGLLDEHFFFGVIDWDYSLRIRKKGYRLFYYPYAEVYHFGGKSKAPIKKELFISDNLNRYYFYRKHYGQRVECLFRCFTVMVTYCKLAVSLFHDAVTMRAQFNKQRHWEYITRIKIALGIIH